VGFGNRRRAIVPVSGLSNLSKGHRTKMSSVEFIPNVARCWLIKSSKACLTAKAFPSTCPGSDTPTISPHGRVRESVSRWGERAFLLDPLSERAFTIGISDDETLRMCRKSVCSSLISRDSPQRNNSRFWFGAKATIKPWPSVLRSREGRNRGTDRIKETTFPHVAPIDEIELPSI
jgi:hypothetical protein